MSNQCISVIIPVYNTKKYLRTCLNSVCHQTYCNLEILLIDDGSTDGSLGICDYYAQMDKRVHVFHKENTGVSDSRNIGILASHGDYVAFVDSDDIICRNMMEELILLSNKYNAQIAMCGFSRFQENQQMPHNVTDQVQIGVMDRKQALQNVISNHEYCGFLWNKLFSKSLFVAANKMIQLRSDIYMCEDLLAVCQLIDRADRVACTTAKLYCYRQRSLSAAQMITDRTFSCLTAKACLLPIYEKYGLKDAASGYVYTLAYLLSFINEPAVKQRKQSLTKELRAKRKWFVPKIYTLKETFFFCSMCAIPALAARTISAIRKIKKKVER